MAAFWQVWVPAAFIITLVSIARVVMRAPHRDNLCQQAQKRGEIISPAIQEYIDAHILPQAYRRRRRKPQ